MIVKIKEYQKSPPIDKKLISGEDRVFLHKLQFEGPANYEARFHIHETADSFFILALNYVGTVQLDRVRINILPRFDEDFSQLLMMVMFTHDVDYKHYERELSSGEQEPNLYEIIIQLLLAQTKNVLKKGIFKEYNKKNENLKAVRGRIDLKKHLMKNYLQGDRIYCNFDELETDVVENQIILAALEIASRLAGRRHLIDQVEKYKSIFETICLPYQGNKLPQPFPYHRLNNHYKEVHTIAKILIENTDASMYNTGKKSMQYGLLVDMNGLFEAFVSKLFARFLGDTHVVKSQLVVSNAISTAGNQAYRYIKPDIYLREKETGRKIIIDTKNKNYGSGKVQSGDIYQMAYYGKYFFDDFLDPVNLLIIYPMRSNDSHSVEPIYLNTYKKSQYADIKVRGLDVNEFLEMLKDCYRNRKEIHDKLLEIID